MNTKKLTTQCQREGCSKRAVRQVRRRCTRGVFSAPKHYSLCEEHAKDYERIHAKTPH